MSSLLLVRHGLTAKTGPVLTGRTAGVHLDDRGQRQAAAVAERIAALPLAAIVTSPLERCVDTAEFVQAAQQAAGREPGWHVDERLIECGYGSWTGREIKELAKDPLWKVVQAHPSAVTFPGPEGESLRGAQARAVDAVRWWNAKLGPDATWLACSHADIIKSIVADALGMHLDEFQRIVIDPCSLTVIRYTELRPFVVRANDAGTDLATLLASLVAAPKTARKSGRSSRTPAGADAVVGGGAGAT